MQNKSNAQKVAKAIGDVLAVVLVIFAAFISAIFSLAKRS